MTRRQDAAYVVQAIGAFLSGSAGEWDWDDFTSCSIGDPQLDSIRKRAAAVELPVGPEERALLEGLVKEAEELSGD